MERLRNLYRRFAIKPVSGVLQMICTLLPNIRTHSLVCLTLSAALMACCQSEAACSGQTDEESIAAFDYEAIEALLASLDAPSFEERESATEALIKQGPDILKPLTVHFFNASSEAGWRIHRVLEGIGKNGNESDFLRSVAIIQLLFGAQDEQSQKRLADLQLQWKATQREEAAKKLKDKGIRFQANQVASGDAAVERMRIEMMIRAAEFRDLGGIEIATGPAQRSGSLPAPQLPQWEDPRKNRQKTIGEIEKIIEDDADINRMTVGKLLPEQLQVVLPPGSLDVSKASLSNDETMALVRELGPLVSLKLRDQNIDESTSEFISSQRTLTNLEFANCTFDDAAERLKLPRTITVIGFSETLPPVEAYDSINQISTLRLSNVELDEETATALAKRRIQMIELDAVRFDRNSIQKLVNMRGLFRVTMSLCDFELDWFEKIRRVNPNLVVAAPKAFLGVQGPIDGVRTSEKTGCQISEVVAGTAAAKAGMQPLDVVIEMDGNEIVRFEDLRLLISQKRPGESMNVKVRRDEKELDLSVVLGDLNAR